MSVKLGVKRYTINILKSLNPAMKKIKRESICKLRIHPFSRPEKEEIEVDGSGTFSISLLRNGLVYQTSPLEDFMIVSFKKLTLYFIFRYLENLFNYQYANQLDMKFPLRLFLWSLCIFYYLIDIPRLLPSL